MTERGEQGGTEAEPAPRGRARSARLRPGERRFLAVLGLPAFGTGFGLTAISTYVPTLLHDDQSPVMIGLIIAGEGAAGLILPLPVGVASDRFSRTVAGRLRFLLIAAPLCVAGLLAVATDLGPGVIIAGTATYFVGHFAYLTPFEALYPDLVPNAESGRSRGAASMWRFVGLGAALIAGGFLIDLWAPSVFLTGAAAITMCTLVFGRSVRRDRNTPMSGARERLRQLLAELGGLLADRNIRLVVSATLVWNFALQALKTFVVLYFTVGLGRSPAFVSGLIFPLVALGLLISVPLAGKLADRLGHVRVLTVATLVYGLGVTLPGFIQAPWVLGLIPVVAAAAGAVMTLPFSVLMRLLPADRHGAASGVFLVGRAAGCLAGPLAAGVAIENLDAVFPATHGYAALWFVVGGGVLLALPLLGLLRVPDRDDPRRNSRRTSVGKTSGRESGPWLGGRVGRITKPSRRDGDG